MDVASPRDGNGAALTTSPQAGAALNPESRSVSCNSKGIRTRGASSLPASSPAQLGRHAYLQPSVMRAELREAAEEVCSRYLAVST